MKDEKLQYFWGSRKNLSFKGRFTKSHYIGRDGLKRGAWTVCGFKGEGLGKKEGGGVFEGG